MPPACRAAMLATMTSTLMLATGEVAHAESSNSPLPLSRSVAGVKAEPVVTLLKDIPAKGMPVVSPDGRWVAVRLSEVRLTVFRIDGPPDAGLTVDCARPSLPEGWSSADYRDWSGDPPPAVFAEDSASLIVTGEDSITRIALGSTPKIVDTQMAPDGVLPAAISKAGVWPLTYSKDGGKMLRLWTREGWRGEPIAISPTADTVCWIANPLALAATNAAGDVIVIDPADGAAKRLVTAAEVHAAIPGIDRKPIRVIRMLARGEGSSLLIEAERAVVSRWANEIPPVGFEPDHENRTADEEPKRGQHPGSSEPSADMPRYRLLKQDGQWSLVSLISMARPVDSWLEAPSVDLKRLLRLQVSNDGGIHAPGKSHIWIQGHDLAGRPVEHELGNAGLDAELGVPEFEWLSVSPDAREGLVWMKARRFRSFRVDDPEVRRKFAPNAPAGKEDFTVGSELISHFKRSSGASGNGVHIIHFASYGIFRVTADGRFIPQGRMLGEGVSPFDDDIDLPGCMGRPAWCEATRTLVATLHGPDGPDSEEPRGMVLIHLDAKP